MPLESVVGGFSIFFIYDFRHIRHFGWYIVISSLIMGDRMVTCMDPGANFPGSPLLDLREIHPNIFSFRPLKSVIGGFSIFFIYDCRHMSHIGRYTITSSLNLGGPMVTCIDLQTNCPRSPSLNLQKMHPNIFHPMPLESVIGGFSIFFSYMTSDK